MSKYQLGQKIEQLIANLSTQIEGLPQPIHLIAIFSGGLPVAKEIRKCLNSKKIKNKLFTAYFDTVGLKCLLKKTDFGTSDYIGTAVIVEDVIWTGHHLPPIKRYLKRLNPHKKYYIAALFDCSDKADFSVFP
jgi:hypoxanthine-guanine phosphoribosyltransferase